MDVLYIEEKATWGTELIQFLAALANLQHEDFKKRMDAFKKWTISQFTPHQTSTLTKWLFSQKRFFKSTLLLNGQRCIQECPLCRPFCIYPSSVV